MVSRMIAIVMCDRNFAIASNGKQPIHLKEDLKRFRKRTNHATVVYGRKTLEELPGGLLLPERRNLILSRNRNLVVSDSNHSKIVHSVTEVIRLMEDDVRRFIAFGENAKLYRPFYVIGGSEIYYQFITYCDEVIMTMVDTEFEYPTACFPDLRTKDPITKRPEWIKKYNDVSVEDVDVDTGEVYQTKILHWIAN